MSTQSPDLVSILRPDTDLGKDLIGGKALSIARMMRLGLPVPPAFVVTTEACRDYLAKGELSETLKAEIRRGMKELEAATQRGFGDTGKPLILSVRSGAAISMPGMMDTILNLGVNEKTEAGLAEAFGDPGFARNVHRRFFELYAAIVLRTFSPEFRDADGPEEWRLDLSRSHGVTVPECLEARLFDAVRAVFNSWNTRRAKRYRRHHGIPDDLGTAVTIQAMVFGNRNAQSGTGVLFTRNPLTGENAVYGEYLPQAQGEDVVSGKKRPLPLATLGEEQPQVMEALLDGAQSLEVETRDMQDIEFTVEDGKLYFLQHRSGKRTAAAAARIAVEMVQEGRLTEREALSRISPDQALKLLASRLDADAAAGATLLVTGEGVSPGVRSGIVVATADEAEARAAAGETVILARETTSPDDVHGMIAAAAVITDVGGSTSHAAVVSRSLGVPCVANCGEGASGALIGEEVTVDGAAGKIYRGILPVIAPSEEGDDVLTALISWAREASPVKVRAPARNDEGPEVVDLDHCDGGDDPSVIETLLGGRKKASGSVLMTPEGMRAAIAAGLEEAVGRPPLPYLLAAIQSGEVPA